MTLARRIRPVLASEVAGLPRCPPGCPHALVVDEPTWAPGTEHDLGWCGVRLCDGEQTVGYLLLAAPRLAPLRGPYLTTPISRDAAVVVKVWVDPARRCQGVGRQLVQSAAAASQRSGVRAIEAIASIGAGSCATPPVGWLQHAGFVIARNHPLHPRVRLELDRTVRVPHWSLLLDRVRALMRGPQAPPQPTSRATAEAHRGALTPSG